LNQGNQSFKSIQFKRDNIPILKEVEVLYLNLLLNTNNLTILKVLVINKIITQIHTLQIILKVSTNNQIP